MSRRWWIVVGLVALLVVAGLLRARRGSGSIEVEIGKAELRDVFRSYVTASGEIVAERYADIGSSVMGRVVELPVIEGQSVSQGDLLARIDPVQARSQLEAAAAAIQALESEAQGSSDQIESARANLQLAEAQAREATANYQRRQSLAEQKLIPASELDSARASSESSTAQVAAARAALARAQEARNAALRRVAQAKAQADQARDLLQKTAIVSPISGVVSRLQVREGEMVVIGIQNQPGTVLLTISDLSVLNAEVKVAEADVLRVATGQTATATLEALPDQTFRGHVTEVGASALPRVTAGAAAREFRVEIRLEDAAPGMRPGLTCDAEILVSEKRDVTVVPLQSVVIQLDENGEEKRGVFATSGGEARFVPVETGIIGGLDIEVRSIEPGKLEAGTEVVVGPYQVLRVLEDGARVRAR